MSNIHPKMPMAATTNILERFSQDVQAAGLVGETRTAKLLYLALTSRVFDRPVSVILKGPSSAGKSQIVCSVLRFFPEAAYYELTAMSKRALAHFTEPLSHRFLIIYEADGVSQGTGAYMLRTLLSEGNVRYAIAESVDGEMTTRTKEVKGPTGLVLTTTLRSVHAENETRLFSIPVDGGREQTRSVLLGIASENDTDTDLTSWHDLQLSLMTGEQRVTIPYARSIAEKFPDNATRARRDFGAVLTLIRSHALLHRQSRDRDVSGRIIATPDDYNTVRDLLVDILSDGNGDSVSPKTRQTVAVVESLNAGGGNPVGVKDVAESLNIHKSSASRRIREAIAEGYLVNQEPRPGHPDHLITGAPLPEKIEALPPVEILSGCTVARETTEGEEPAASRVATALPLPARENPHRSTRSVPIVRRKRSPVEKPTEEMDPFEIRDFLRRTRTRLIGKQE